MSQAGPLSASSDPTIPLDFVTDSGTAIASANILNVLGGTGITTSGSGNTIIIDASGAVGVTSITGTAPLTMNGVSGSAQSGAVTAALTTPLVEVYGGTAQSTYTLGDTLYSSATNTLSKLAGNTQSTLMVLSQLGDGTNSAAPVWIPLPTTSSSIYMFANIASDIATYYQAVSSSLYVVGTLGSATASVSTTPVLIVSFATNSGYPNLSNIPPGLFAIHYETQKDTGAQNYYTYAEIYKRTSGGVETLLLTSDNSTTTSSNTIQQITITSYNSSNISLNTTDRIVVKIYAVLSSTTKNITVYWDNTTSARLEIPISSSSTTISATAPLTANGLSGTFQSGAVTLALTTPLALTYGGTNASLVASNGGIFYSTATAGAILAGTATANKMLLSGATAAPTWSTSTIPSSAGAVANKVLLSDGTNYVLSTPTFPNASATAGKIIISDGTNWIASTPTFPNTATGTGTILRADGTNWVATTATYPTTTTINQILYSSAANTIGGITASANGVLISSATSVPSWLAAGTTGQYLAATTGSPPSWATLSSAAVTSITGTANQITASASVGSVTLSFPATGGISIGSYQATSPPTGGIICPGAVSVGTTSPGTSQFLVDSTGEIGLTVQGTTANTTSQIGVYVSQKYQGKSGGINSSAVFSNPVFATQVGTPISNASCFIASPDFTSNLGTITNVFGFYFSGGGSSSGTITNSYGAYLTVPVAGTNKHALHADNLSVGTYTGASVPPSNGAIISGQLSIGSVSPVASSKLFVSTSGSTESWVDSATANLANRVWSKTGTAKWQMYVPGNSNDLRLYDSSDRFYFISGGSFGIKASPLSNLDVNGSASIGSYAGVSAAPSNSLIISGVLGVGTTTTNSSTNLIQAGNSTTASSNYIAVDAANAVDKGFQWYSAGVSRVFAIVPGGSPTVWQLTTGVQCIGVNLTNARVMIGTGTALNRLDVNGALAGGTYAGVNTAPSNTCMFSGGFISGSGSASTAAYTFFSDNSSGMYYTSNTVNFTTAGARRAYIDSNGITIPNPGYLITDNGTSSGGTLHHAFRTSGSTIRWAIGLQNTEPGSGNAGSNFNLFGYTDAGGFLSNPITVLRTSGTVGFNTGSAANTSSIFHSLSTTAYNTLLSGTQTAVDGSSYQSSLYVTSVHNPTNGSTLSTGLHVANSIASPSTKTILFGCGLYVAPTVASNVGTISAFTGVYIGQADASRSGTVTSGYNLYINQPFPSSTGNYYALNVQGGQIWFRTTTSVSETETTARTIVGVTSTAAARTITLPATPPDSGWIIVVKDESGGAATNNITVAGNGNNIDGAANYTINTNYGSVMIYSSGSKYFTMAKF